MQMEKFGRKKKLLVFSCAISSAAKIGIRQAIREVFNPHWTEQTLERFAEKLNPKIRGWFNYYTRFNKHEALKVFCCLNDLIRKWVGNKFKLHSIRALFVKYNAKQAANANLFYHWTHGIRA